MLTSLKVHTKNKVCMLSASVRCWACLFLQQFETQIFVHNPQKWWSMDPPPHLKFLWLFGGSSWLSNSDSTVSTFSSVCTASADARTPVYCSELHQQPVDAVLCPSYAQKLCYKLPSTVTFTFIQIFDRNFVSFTEQSQRCRVCLLQRQNSRYFWCPVWKTKSR